MTIYSSKVLLPDGLGAVDYFIFLKEFLGLCVLCAYISCLACELLWVSILSKLCLFSLSCMVPQIFCWTEEPNLLRKLAWLSWLFHNLLNCELQLPFKSDPLGCNRCQKYIGQSIIRELDLHRHLTGHFKTASVGWSERPCGLCWKNWLCSSPFFWKGSSSDCDLLALFFLVLALYIGKMSSLIMENM